MASMTFEPAPDGADPYLWLEDVTGAEALDWVRARNKPTTAAFCDAEFERMRVEALEVLDTDARIPYVNRRGNYLYNFWRDAANPPGLWRRTTLDSYRTDSPGWDVLIDVDELGRADDQKWVWGGAGVIEPDYTRALIGLSPGGSDASIVREFDMLTREFVEDGFQLPPAKSQITWEDPDTVLLGTDFGGDSLTTSGYPRVIKRWRRGKPLADAETIFEGAGTDVRVNASADRTPGFERTLRHHQVHCRLTAGRRIRRIPCRLSGITGGVRTRRAHRAVPIRLDPRPAVDRHPGRRGEPRRDRNSRQLAT